SGGSRRLHGRGLVGNSVRLSVVDRRFDQQPNRIVGKLARRSGSLHEFIFIDDLRAELFHGTGRAVFRGPRQEIRPVAFFTAPSPLCSIGSLDRKACGSLLSAITRLDGGENEPSEN